MGQAVSQAPRQKGPTMARAMREAVTYHRWITDSFIGYLRPGGSTLEIGAGHGEHTAILLDAGLKVTASDIDPAAVASIRERFLGRPGFSALEMDGVEPGRLAASFENAVAINVMEHIQDDLEFLRSLNRALKPGGRLALFVPAFPALYSAMDAQAGHFRRYRRAGLAASLEQAGFSVLWSRHFNFVGFFGWWLNKLAGMGVDNPGTNMQVRIFDRLAPLFRLFDVFHYICGQSIIAVAEKRKEL